jgi:hypothetical protein
LVKKHTISPLVDEIDLEYWDFKKELPKINNFNELKNVTSIEFSIEIGSIEKKQNLIR